MASIRKFRDKWRAEIARQGVRKSKLFPTKAEASRWAAIEEGELLVTLKEAPAGPQYTLQEACEKYIREVSVNKKGHRFEVLRLEAFIRDFPNLVKKKLTDVATPDMVAWRDARLKKVSRGSVQRDLNLLSNVFTVAREEWHWMKVNPFKGMAAPGDNPSRTRLVQPHEVKAVLRWCRYERNTRPRTKIQEVGVIFLLALRTGMRAGEILSLHDTNVDLKNQVAKVHHKTEHITGAMRKVPLSKHAVRILKPLMGNGFLFTINSASLDAMFRKVKSSLLLEDLHFHDTRATALTRMANKPATKYNKKIDPMTLARISGHRDLKILMNTYFRTTEEDIAKSL